MDGELDGRRERVAEDRGELGGELAAAVVTPRPTALRLNLGKSFGCSHSGVLDVGVDDRALDGSATDQLRSV